MKAELWVMKLAVLMVEWRAETMVASTAEKREMRMAVYLAAMMAGWSVVLKGQALVVQKVDSWAV